MADAGKGSGDVAAEVEALRSPTNPDGTAKSDAQLKKDAKKLEKLEKFMAKQAKLKDQKAQKDTKTDDVSTQYSIVHMSCHLLGFTNFRWFLVFGSLSHLQTLLYCTNFYF